MKTILIFKSVDDMPDRQEKGDQSCQLKKSNALDEEEQHWEGVG